MKESDVKDFDVDHILDVSGVFTLFGEVDHHMSEHVIRFILAHNHSPKTRLKHLTLIINSVGGNLHDAFAIIDVIRRSSLPIHTLGLGEISSSGLMIFMAGAEGHRTITANTHVMSHQWHGNFEGKLHELVSVQQDFKLTTARMMAHYAACTKLTEQDIITHLLPAHDVFLDAPSAVKLGIADKIQ